MLTDIWFDPRLPAYWYVLPLTIHGLLGVTAAIVADRKGLSLRRWLVIGIIGGTPALIAALLAKPKA
jgi:hypothetical protein